MMVGASKDKCSWLFHEMILSSQLKSVNINAGARKVSIPAAPEIPSSSRRRSQS